MKISLDFDDFSPMNHRIDLIDELRQRYSGFKVTMFTIPWDIRFNPQGKGTPITDMKYAEWVSYVKKAIKDGWMEIAIHGLTHAPTEFHDLTYEEAKNRIVVAQKMFVNVGIEINDMFKAPQWLINDDGRRAVKNLHLNLMEDGYYNWNIKDDMPKGDLIAHGHIQDVMDNGLEESFTRLMKIPKDAEWVFLRGMI